MSQGIFCKNCFEPCIVNNPRYYDEGLCSADIYCEYCNLTTVSDVCCDDYLEYMELDTDYDDEVYWDSE